MKTNLPIVLGTAAFGTRYGKFASKSLDEPEIREIMKIAENSGIKFFDTAPAYGAAENLIGELHTDTQEIRLITKISKISDFSYSKIFESLKISIKLTNVPKIWALLIHDSAILKRESVTKIRSIFKELLQTNLVDKIGISTYSIKDSIDAKAIFPELTVFQFPENLCDRRSRFYPELSSMKSQGEIFLVRSVFLQGLLLLNSKSVPDPFKPIIGSLQSIERVASKYEVNNIDLCMSYANSLSWASGIIVGPQSGSQLKEILNFKSIDNLDWLNDIEILSDWFLDPRNWS